MTTTRKRYSPKFKAKVAVEAIRGERPLSHLAWQYQCARGANRAVAKDGEGVDAGSIRRWAQAEACGRGGGKGPLNNEEIGRLKVELDWLKTKEVCWTEPGARAGGTGQCRDQYAAAVRTIGGESARSVLRAGGRT